MSIIPDSIPDALTSPGFFTAFEPSRMVVENSALALATPLLVRQQRTSEGHPILMVTGALSTNIGTNQMRRVLTRMGHHPHTPPNTTMFHKPMRILEIVKEESEKLYEQYREPITLAGWCMGGVFTRMTAQAMPDKVRQVINMGTARTAVWYPKDLGAAAEPLPVPSTVIYSRTDGMTYCKARLRARGPAGGEHRGAVQPLGHGQPPAHPAHHHQPAGPAARRVDALPGASGAPRKKPSPRRTPPQPEP